MAMWTLRFFSTPPTRCSRPFPDRTSSVPGIQDETPDDARARLRQQFKKESTELLKIAPATEKAWIDSILILETAARLNLKDEMYIYGITATNRELAGGGMFAFLGFFDLTLRQHDYNLGRKRPRLSRSTPETASPSELPARPSLHLTSVPSVTTPPIPFLCPSTSA